MENRLGFPDDARNQGDPETLRVDLPCRRHADIQLPALGGVASSGGRISAMNGRVRYRSS